MNEKKTELFIAKYTPVNVISQMDWLNVRNRKIVMIYYFCCSIHNNSIYFRNLMLDFGTKHVFYIISEQMMGNVEQLTLLIETRRLQSMMMMICDG